MNRSHHKRSQAARPGSGAATLQSNRATERLGGSIPDSVSPRHYRASVIQAATIRKDFSPGKKLQKAGLPLIPQGKPRNDGLSSVSR